jgi:glutathione synthase/RimK-type ligase-like ATP-grasp enzyme
MILDAFEPSSAPRVYVIHENDDWVLPLRYEFAELGVPHAEWFLSRGRLNLSSTPPEGIFYNRMSASSHTRDHRFAPEFTAAVLAWLKRHGRTIVNGERAVQLEVSKVAQYEALKAVGVPTPDTVAVIGKENIAASAERIGFPVILKHNRAGKGLGVRLLYSAAAVAEHLASGDFEESIDGITLVQRYIEAPEPYITRVEFVGGKVVYAVRVDTSEGFELCPADVCRIDEAANARQEDAPNDMFKILAEFDHPLLPAWQAFLAGNDIKIAGIEFIEDASGRSFTYDVNTNTNYNSEAEAKDGRKGMRAIAEYLGKLLSGQYGAASGVASAA